MKTRFIVNARSGHAATALPAVRAYAEAHRASVVLTERAGHGAELARQAVNDGNDVVVAVGGDGTLNEVASALVGTAATFGLVPCGSGDGLGRHLKIHGSVAHALSILERGHVRQIDTGLADGHPFFTTAGIGFEAEIAARFNRLQRRGFGRYLTTIASALRSWRPEHYVITHAAGVDPVTAFTLTVANANQYGNGVRIAPGASVSDGKLNLTALREVSVARAILLAIRLFGGTIDRSDRVFARVGERFVIERPGPGPLHTDGEVREAGATVVFEVRPASLRVVTP